MIQPSDIQRLRDLPIEEVAERLSIRVKRHKALCPFHCDTHASLTFHRTKNLYRCFVCEAHGSTIDLVMNKLHLTFPEACRWLSDQSNVIIETEAQRPRHKPQEERPFDAARYSRVFLHPTIDEAAHRFLYDERHIDPRVVSWCRLNSYKDWLQIPYYDRDYRLVGIQQRYLGTDPSQPRFRFPQGAQTQLYNLPVIGLLKPHEPLFITEGCSDCWSVLSSGHKAIAIPSATLLKEGDLAPLIEAHERLGTTFHMYPDQDPPGVRLYLQLKELFSTAIGGTEGIFVHHQLPEEYKDFSDYYRSQFKKT